ncbi:hypothetical protein GF339_11975 [candidate division KSB3 bacterium]|uniref:Phosphatidylglycerol--prolipoprotein diacylglyceryl transferase n=1 Tax=candidate division KSB3 bacterium TaxID=2044937 RepID=A0A9D5JWP6_9BACT|nr:hypothetical protein [candidate division KSB3 bacterium]MBD3325297.1 hypothetical protein [candidate division KSB3 bacterium]
MYPILFDVPGFTLYTQTLCLFLAFIAGLLVAVRQGRRFGLQRLDVTDVVLWGFLIGIVGARLLFMVLHGEATALSLSEICTLGTTQGGFSLHGGLLVGGLVVWLAAKYHRLPLWRLADALAPGLAIAMFFMRLGCLFNGCDYGIATTLPWGIPLHGAIRHPIQLYEGLGNLLLLPVLSALNRKPLKPGRVCLLYLLLSSLLRLGVDMYRDDPARVWVGLTVPQLLAAGIALLAAVGLVFRLPQRLSAD